MRSFARLLVGLLALGGCLLRTPDPPRFFRPASATLAVAAGDGADPTTTDGIPVRVRTIRSAPFLGERIVWRVSDVEYGFYEQRRWIDLPAHYVERALRIRLRSTPGLRLTNDVRAAALNVNVRAFDDLLAPTHAANVALAVVLEDPARGPLLERTFSAQANIGDDDSEAMAKAMGQALDDVVAQVADAVKLSLQRYPAGGAQ